MKMKLTYLLILLSFTTACIPTVETPDGYKLNAQKEMRRVAGLISKTLDGPAALSSGPLTSGMTDMIGTFSCPQGGSYTTERESAADGAFNVAITMSNCAGLGRLVSGDMIYENLSPRGDGWGYTAFAASVAIDNRLLTVSHEDGTVESNGLLELGSGRASFEGVDAVWTLESKYLFDIDSSVWVVPPEQGIGAWSDGGFFPSFLSRVEVDDNDQLLPFRSVPGFPLYVFEELPGAGSFNVTYSQSAGVYVSGNVTSEGGSGRADFVDDLAAFGSGVGSDSTEFVWSDVYKNAYLSVY